MKGQAAPFMGACPLKSSGCWPRLAEILADENSTNTYLRGVREEAANYRKLHIRAEDVASLPCSSTCGGLASEQGCIDLCQGRDERELLGLNASVGRLIVAYLPTAAMMRAHMRQMEVNASLDRALFLSTLHALQYPRGEAHALEMRKVPYDGATAMLLQTARHMSWAMNNNRTYWPDLTSFDAHFADLPGCSREQRAGPSIECVLQPLSSCSWPSHLNERCPETASRWTSLARRINGVRIAKRGPQGDKISYGPQSQSLRRHGGFWLHSQLLNFLFRLQPDVEELFARDRSSIAFESPIIGMHIRHGDKCRLRLMPSLLCKSIAPFMKAAWRLHERYHVRNIFLATDDTNMLAACRASSHFNCIAYPDQTRGLNTVRVHTAPSVKDRNDTSWSRATNSSVALSIFREVDTLARCDFFIGTLGLSGVSTAAYELLVARRYGKHSLSRRHFPIDPRLIALTQLVSGSLQMHLYRSDLAKDAEE
ncbi:MAG: hypothetical protein SGPRY_010798 [Prymnesium sp.]